MMTDNVLLLRLYEKTSAKGNTYFAGRMGAASVVMMRDLHTEGDDPVWQVFVSEPRHAGSEGHTASKPARPAQTPITKPKARKTAPTPKLALVADLNDDIHDIGT